MSETYPIQEVARRTVFVYADQQTMLKHASLQQDQGNTVESIHNIHSGRFPIQVVYEWHSHAPFIIH